MAIYPASEFERLYQYGVMRDGIDKVFTAAQKIGLTATVNSQVYGQIEVVAGIAAIGVVEGPLGVNKHPIRTTFARYSTPLDEKIVHVVQNGSFIPNKTIPLTPCVSETAAVISDQSAVNLVAFTVRALEHTHFDSNAANIAAATLRNRPGIYGISGEFDAVEISEEPR